MSNRRVKSLAYDDDDFDDYDDDDQQYENTGDEQISEEDKQQLRLGTVKVRESLGPAYTIGDSEIHEALWHYYYDVAKSVSYLKNKHKPKQVAKPLKPAEPKSVLLQQPLPFTIKGFFDDCPWLQIPAHRRADIIIEPIHPRGGLLGGSSGDRKMSKLAALRANRKNKENAKPDPATTTAAPTTEDYATNLSKLTLESTPTPRNKRKTAPDQSEGDLKRLDSGIENPDQIQNIDEDEAETSNLAQEHEEPIIVARAAPSAFASTILASKTSAHHRMELQLTDHSSSLFDFAQPSPDDVISIAQHGKTTINQNLKAKETTKKTEITNGVESLKIQDSVKVKSKNLDVAAEYQKLARKNAANFVVIGHVDAGKSTLMGRLLFDLKAVDQRTMDKYQKEADSIGKGSFAFAWVLDQGSEERARGVTIDIATNKFETEKTNFTILDAPGHQDFVPNMIAGASQADFAVLVIDASGGNFESGLRGQTKEHALLVRSIGVQRIIVAINKMDMADWNQDRYLEITEQLSAFLTTAGFQNKNIAFVPCSGLEGGNILSKTTDQRASWYTGKTLVEELDLSEPVSHTLDKPLRMTITDVFRGSIQNPLSISGRIESGTLQVGEEITIMPSGERASIKSLEVDEEPSDWAVAGQNVVLNLTEIDPAQIKTGDVVCSPTSPITNIDSFKAKILAFTNLTPQLVDVHRGRLHVPGRIAQLLAVLDKNNGTEIKKKPKVTQPNSVVRVNVRIDTPVPLETGQRVIFRAGGETVAAGIIE